MRHLQFLGAGIAVLAMLIGCRSGSLTGVIPSEVSAFAPDQTACRSSGNLILHVRVPSNSGTTKLVVSDSIYDYAPIGACTLYPKSCPNHVCTAYFSAPPSINDVRVAAFASGKKSPSASGHFPVAVHSSGTVTKTAVLRGSIAKIEVQPFLASYLPVGQDERVWVTALDDQNDVIIGSYKPAIDISTKGLVPTLATLQSSADAEKLAVSWADPLKVPGNDTGMLSARVGSAPPKTVRVKPANGIVYFSSPLPNSASAGPGPVATSPDGTSVYFAINDNRGTGCPRPTTCTTLLERFMLSTQTFSSPVPLRRVPGISQLYFTHDGGLWMASTQPVGQWHHALPVLYMPGGQFSESALRYLPPSFGEASGFVEDQYGNLWISGCSGTYCQQDQNGSPTLVEVSTAGSPSQPVAVYDLPLSCTKFGYLGYTVGDVAYLGSRLYVIGLNDGSAPPARGTIWQFTPASGSATCVGNLPNGFNPSEYFATVTGSGGNALIFGAGGNGDDYRWPPNHGFYSLIGGLLATPAPDLTPVATVQHVSASNGVVYYVHLNNLADGANTAGLGWYQPATGRWNTFPSQSFSGPQSQDGVAALSNGAWFTASSVCSSPPPARPWRGVCLGRARYLSAGAWGIVPGLYLPKISIGTGGAFSPMNVHSGPLEAAAQTFHARSENPSVCETHTPPPQSTLLFSVTATNKTLGACPLIVTGYGRSEPVVTVVTNPSP